MKPIDRYEKDFDPGSNLVKERYGKISPRGSFAFTRLLLERDRPGDRDRACQILDAALGTQLMEPSRERGRFPMLIEEEWRDLNSNLFLMPDLIGILANHVAKLPPPLAERCEKAARLAVHFAEGRWDDEVFDLHRDFKAYSNIFVLYVQFLFLAGRYYRDERLLQNAEAQWRRWFNQIAYYGIDECVSPTYNAVVYGGLLRVYDLTQTDRTHTEIGLVLDHLSALQYAIAHPTLRMPICGASRSYRQFRTAGQGEFPFTSSIDEPTTYRPPESVTEEYQNRIFPHTMSGRATAVPFRFKSWQNKHSGMGSMTGGLYFGQQINLMAAAGRSPTERAVAFIPGGVGRNMTNGYACQRDGQALCVFARVPNSYYRTQRVTPDTAIPGEDRHPHCVEITDGWHEEENNAGRLVLSAYGHVLFFSPFALSDDQVVPISLEPTTAKDKYFGTYGTAYAFPKDAVWFGCFASLMPEGESAPPPEIEFRRSDHTLEFTAAGELSIRLFVQPSGELTELYDEDWRITPLLDCPTGMLWPGELAERIANECGSPETE